MDVFSYARLPPHPPSQQQGMAALAACCVLAACFLGSAWMVAETASAPLLVMMTVWSCIGFGTALRFTRRTMALVARASTMAVDFEDDPPRELVPAQRGIFNRLIDWDKDPVSDNSASAAIWGGLVLALLPLPLLAVSGVPSSIGAAIAGLSGLFATLLLTMTTLDHLAVRPVVGILARAQLKRLEAGGDEPVSRAAKPARRRPPTGIRR